MMLLRSLLELLDSFPQSGTEGEKKMFLFEVFSRVEFFLAQCGGDDGSYPKIGIRYAKDILAAYQENGIDRHPPVPMMQILIEFDNHSFSIYDCDDYESAPAMISDLKTVLSILEEGQPAAARPPDAQGSFPPELEFEVEYLNRNPKSSRTEAAGAYWRGLDQNRRQELKNEYGSDGSAKDAIAKRMENQMRKHCPGYRASFKSKN
ncbi:MAG: hypothetical protein NXI32_19155 [bacterium]|nr:hypothetical protein [bacterium]